MKTLLPKAWLAGSVLDFMLLEYWFSVAEEAHMYYMTLDYSKSHGLPGPEQVNHYQMSNPIRPSANGAYAHRPVIFLIHSDDHYFSVVFDYLKLTAYIFGSSISGQGLFQGEKLWKSWRGSELWSSFALYHGWEPSDPTSVTVFARHWPQVCSKKFYGAVAQCFSISEWCRLRSYRRRCHDGPAGTQLDVQ
jgi:hypothetical protein